ncbi:MAG: NAD(P)/FAD-dependent oxidoreductase [Opitutae bacterium]|nr:NAD(P)/FAD-dependent oxidoreductase [Opitutae bacterium]
MKNFVILGAGTAGTIMANKLARALPSSGWRITVVDRDNDHPYQPGFLFVPFHGYEPQDLVKSRRKTLHPRVDFVEALIERIEPDHNRVHLKGGHVLAYDFLIIATGTQPVPAQNEGMLGDEWHKSVGEFYTLEGCTALQRQLDQFKGGRLVVNIAEMPIKCPVAPLEFAFLADSYFRAKGMRDKVEIDYVTPLPAAFTKPKAAELLGDFLDKRRIHLTADFALGRVDQEAKKIHSWDEREVAYDLLVTVPTNMGDPVIGASGIGDELNYVPTDKHTLVSKVAPNIFALGDATDLPSSKAGSVAHFQADVLMENILSVVAGNAPEAKFDGHANCFIESGDGKALLIDFSYDVEPLPGHYPLPHVGPMSLLKETRLNHFGKLMFRWVYWNMLLPARPMPVGHAFSMSGKKTTAA